MRIPGVSPGSWLRGSRLGVALTLVLLGVMGLGAGCRTHPIAQPEGEAVAQAETGPTFRLRYAPGAHLQEKTRLAADLELPNCQGTETLTHLHTQPYDSATDLTLDTEALPADLAPLRGVMAAIVRETYRLAGAYPPTIEEGITLHAPAGARQEHRLTWAETWDGNVLEVLHDGALVAEVPVQVLTGATLEDEVREAVACEAGPLEGEDTVPLILALGRPLETPSAPEVSGGPCEPPLAITAGQQQVARYVELLQMKDYAGAYALLAESYRLRLPFRQYAAGYAPVGGLALCTLDTPGGVGADREVVYATLRLTLQVGAATEEQLWVGRYEVLRDGAIASVSMFKASLSDE